MSASGATAAGRLDYALGDAHHWDTARVLKEAERYASGQGARRAPARAYALYCLAAGRGGADAAYALGRFYLHTNGARRDPRRAAGWLALAAERGNQRARRLLQTGLQRVDRQTDDRCPQPGLTGTGQTQLRRWARALATQYGLDDDLVIALIEAESSFNPKARSAKGAIGLMQLMPGTARRFGVRDATDPVDNMRGGMAYLSWLLRRFDGKRTLALAAYNAGEHAVDRYQGIPPYKETRAYVRRVLGNGKVTAAGKQRRIDPAKRNSRRHRRLARMLGLLPET